MSKKEFFIRTFISNFIGSIEFTLSTCSMLSIINSHPQETAIISTYISKDIVGQVGGSCYNYYQCKKIDKNIPRFVNQGLALQHLSTLIECSVPFLSSSSLMICTGGVSSLLKNISFTQIGAVNAKMLYKFSSCNENTGELYTRLSVLNSLSTSLGMTIGVFISYKIPDPETRLGIVALLSLMNIYNYKLLTKNVLA